MWLIKKMLSAFVSRPEKVVVNLDNRYMTREQVAVMIASAIQAERRSSLGQRRQ